MCRPPARRNLLAATVFVAATAAWALCRSAALADSSGASLLQSAISSDDRISYTGSVTAVVYGHDRTIATVARIDHKAPRLWRVWYVAPADAYGRMIVSSESLTYQYEPKAAKVYRNDWERFAPALVQSLNVAQVEKNYLIEAGAASVVAGRPARTLSLTSKYSKSLIERLWIDNSTKLILQRETYHANGTIATKTNFDNLRIVTDFPKGLFDLTVPQGMTLEQGAVYTKSTTNMADLVRSVRFKISGPKYLPDGFSLEKGDVEWQGDVQTVQFVYTDGIRSFSLFENTTGRLPQFEGATAKPIQVGDASGRYAFVGSDTLVSWNAGGLNLTLVGDLSPSELAKIGKSIQP